MMGGDRNQHCLRQFSHCRQARGQRAWHLDLTKKAKCLVMKPGMWVAFLNFPEFFEVCYVLRRFASIFQIRKDFYASLADLLIGSGQTFTLAPTSPGTCRRASTKGNLCSNSLTPCTVQGGVAVAC